ncbi:MAG: sigma-54 dependent transcriptional regulator [Nitrospirota bacterium]|jgi:DNA-binding NtrC family response regulator
MEKVPAILVAEDDDAVRAEVERALVSAEYSVSTVRSMAEALRALKSRSFDVIVTGTHLPDAGESGTLDAFGKASDAVMIVINESGTIKEVVKAIKMGALDYIVKPFSTDEFLLVIQRALDFRRLSQENIRLRRNINEFFNWPNIVGESDAMLRVFSVIDRVAATDSTIIITGESGTGKELVAKIIHYQSPRAERPLVKINCAALPEGLIESELFGHERGAFTGAMKQKKGRFELADGGTIFLDEVGDLSMSTQVKLLRVLQERCFERIGGSETIEVDVRVIAATNKDLQLEVDSGRFREDLFFRLNVIPITVPPLRERRGDIPLLIEYFLGKYEHKTSRSVRFSKEAVDVLLKYSYPGNVRELENIIERCATLSVSNVIKKEDLPRFLLDKSSQEPLLPLSELVSITERDYITRVLEHTNGSKVKAMDILGISRKSLWKKMKKYNIKL